MELGMVGLGRMGGNMVRRMARGGVKITGYTRNPETRNALAAEAGFESPDSVAAMVAQLDSPRIVWLMLPAGDITEAGLQEVCDLLSPGDIVVDGANSMFKDSMRRAAEVEARGLHWVDAGVSGGVWGLENGYAIMLGGREEAVAHVTRFIEILAPGKEQGWLHCGPAGSGHFVKMVHNGIEYGMMQAMAEGFALMKAREDFALDLGAIAEMWRHGSVVRSWLLDLTAEFLQGDQELTDIAPVVADSGEGRWTALEAVELGVPAPVMSLALMMRYATQGSNDYPARLLAMMRKGFGGHAVTSSGSGE